MPELPEVERGRLVAESVAVGRRIARVECADDPIVFDSVEPARVERALRGRRVLGVHRRGKQLWFDLDQAPHPLFHFGMTGAFRVPDLAPLPLSSGPRAIAGETWPPRFTRIRMGFDDGGELALSDARRFGRIKLREAPLLEPPLSLLGFDPLLDLPGPVEFERRLRARRGNVKGVLLDQRFAAGVGNWIADEVLYQAGIDPRRSITTLDQREVRALRSALGRVVRKAVEVNAEKDRFPATWLFHHRWGKKATARTAEGETVEFVNVAGRTTAWVPRRQR